jgi:hypothetical protein
MMVEFISGVFSALVVSLFVGSFLIEAVAFSHKKQAFDRGFMVQCIGKTGYYWECE